LAGIVGLSQGGVLTTETVATRSPNLVVIGAQKSGTTSLYHCLNSHSQIFMSSPVKEPGYFMKPGFILSLSRRLNHPVASRQEALERFMLRGYEPVRYFGDASAYYTFAGFGEDHRVPVRMKKTDPNIKLIYILRSPFARIVSSYLHAHRARYVQGDFAQFFATDHYERALLTSRYWYQLQLYLRHFHKEQIKVVLFEDFINNCQSVMDDIFQFLELEPEGEVRLETHNRSENRNAFKAGELLFPSTAFQAAKHVIEPEVRRLEDYMQRSLDNWDLSGERWCGVAQPQMLVAS
jgi:hypothetical protein